MIHNFRNVKYGYETISYEERNYTEVDEEGYENNCEDRIEVVINKQHKQSIIFCEYRNKGEGHFSSPVDIIDVLYGVEVYDKFTNFLNHNDNVTVLMTQVVDTTSDYVLIYDKYLTDYDECLVYIHNSKDNVGNTSGYKYKEIKNDIVKRCDF